MGEVLNFQKKWAPPAWFLEIKSSPTSFGSKSFPITKMSHISQMSWDIWEGLGFLKNEISLKLMASSAIQNESCTTVFHPMVISVTTLINPCLLRMFFSIIDDKSLALCHFLCFLCSKFQHQRILPITLICMLLYVSIYFKSPQNKLQERHGLTNRNSYWKCGFVHFCVDAGFRKPHSPLWPTMTNWEMDCAPLGKVLTWKSPSILAKECEVYTTPWLRKLNCFFKNQEAKYTQILWLTRFNRCIRLHALRCLN